MNEGDSRVIKHLTKEWQQSIYEQVLAQYRDVYYPFDLKNDKMNLCQLGRDCLRLSMATCDILGMQGEECRIVAGSARWQVNSGFEYEYRYTEVSNLDVDQIATDGLLPEIHCWAVIGSDLRLIFDPSVVLLPELMQFDYNEKWAGSRMPPARQHHKPIEYGKRLRFYRCEYMASRPASELARELARKVSTR